MSKKLQAHIAVLSANIIFGLNYITIKSLVPSKLSAASLNVCRVVGSAVLFWLLFLAKPGKGGILKKDIPRFVLCAFLGIALNQALFVKGVSLTSSIHASLLALVTPILIIFIAAWILKESLTALKIIGVIIGVGGAVILIVSKDVSHTASNKVLGDILVIINAVAYAFYLVLVKPLMETYSPLQVIRWVFTLGVIFMIPYGGKDFIETPWLDFSFTNWLSLSFIVIGATFFAYLFTVFGISEIGASATGSYIYTQPVFAAIVAIIFTGESYDWLKFLATALIFSGLYLVNYKSTFR